MEKWLKWSERYLLNRKKPDTYFWSHFTFKWLLKKRLRKLWDDTPQNIARDPHILQRILDGDLTSDANPTSGELALLPLVKLNWKKGYRLDEIDRELSARGNIV
ncbi:hypothetical protein BH23BAC3_BH23BAC3_33710 [soil metagenome]